MVHNSQLYLIDIKPGGFTAPLCGNTRIRHKYEVVDNLKRILLITIFFGFIVLYLFLYRKYT